MKPSPRFLLLLLLPGLLYAQAKHVPTLEELLSLKSISSPEISPDGQFVAYSMRETNWKDNVYVSQLWLANAATGAAFQLTRGKKSTFGAQWSPDGRWLAFVTERESSAIEPPSAEKKDEKKEDSKDAGTGGRKPASQQI